MIRSFLCMLTAILAFMFMYIQADADMLPYERLYQDRQLVYLTFDDGPSAQTEEILDILDAYDIKATFFVVGEVKKEYEDMYKAVVRKGHTLALHSYSHDYAKIYADIKGFGNDIRDLKEKLSKYSDDLWLYRFPGGSSNQLSERHIDICDCISLLESEKLVYFDWNVDSGDGAGINVPAEKLLANINAALGLKQQNVLLLHDSNHHRTTVEALRSIIELCLEKDMIFLPIKKTTLPVHHNF